MAMMTKIWIWTSQRIITRPEMLTFLMHNIMNLGLEAAKGVVLFLAQ